MDTAARADESVEAQLKRKRSSSIVDLPANAPMAKTARVTSNQLSINYLARSSSEDLPLIHREETLPNLLRLLSLYSGVLDRHESLASNLGARPLGPILIKRFERCFDAPPKIVASHHKNGAAEDSPPQITWLEVIEFTRSHPSQFTLGTFSEGRRVCQFYYPQRQLRVQISEEDFLFIKSGRCQELIPPLPIWEDEEKEVTTCDVLEAKLKELTNAADMVAARTRQLSHRLKGRRAAILERRAGGGSGTPARVNVPPTTTAHPSAANTFVAVSSHQYPPSAETGPGHTLSVRNELLRHFESLPQNQALQQQQQQQQPQQHHHHHQHQQQQQQQQHQQQHQHQQHHQQHQQQQHSQSRPPARPVEQPESVHGFRSYETLTPEHNVNQISKPASASPRAVSPVRQDAVPIPRPQTQPPAQSSANNNNAPGNSSKHNFSRPLAPALESSQPYRPLCQAHMDNRPRGQRVLPPCDRCRRLRMDCVKNLTSCAGCTKKHARCHWGDVSRDEIGALDHLMESAYAAHSPALSDSNANDSAGMHDSYYEDDDDDGDDDDSHNPLEDLEALRQHDEQERRAASEHNAYHTSQPNSAQPEHLVGSEPVPGDVAQTSHLSRTSDASTNLSLSAISKSGGIEVAGAAVAGREVSLPSTFTDPEKQQQEQQQQQQQRAYSIPQQQAIGPKELGGSHDISARAQAGMDGAGGFRAVNSVLPSAMVKP